MSVRSTSSRRKSRLAKKRMGLVFKQAQADSVANGTDSITMEEINAEIAAYRRERKNATSSLLVACSPAIKTESR